MKLDSGLRICANGITRKLSLRYFITLPMAILCRFGFEILALIGNTFINHALEITNCPLNGGVPTFMGHRGAFWKPMNIFTNSYNEDSTSCLRHPIIRGIQKPSLNFITNPLKITNYYINGFTAIHSNNIRDVFSNKSLRSVIPAVFN